MRAERRLVVAALGALVWIGSAGPAEAQTARLTLERVFGTVATSLTVPFGNVDAQCQALPASGVTCAPEVATSGAIWYGTIEFNVRATGAGIRVRLVAARQSGGSMPAGRLLDGPTGVPATSYPTSPAGPITLASALGGGNNPVARSIGVRVVPADAAGPWTTQVVYSLIVE